LLSAESLDGDEEIEDDETVTWLDNVQDGADAPTDEDFDVELEVDWSSESLSAVLDETRHGTTQDKVVVEEIVEIDGDNNEWPEEWLS